MEPRVLSIQSHVVHGYVGNKSATFPLQALGFEVDAINSVQFSNHTGYSKVSGSVMDQKQLDELYEGLVHNKIEKYSHILTGYIYADSFLRRVCGIVKELKQKNPDLLYVCDPVMGDHGPGMYVPENLIPIYRDEVLAVADIITPNQFEVEKITGRSIKTEADAIAAIQELHEKGPKIVILSSTEFGDKGNILSLASIKTSQESFMYKMSLPQIDAHFVGTGDLFAALTLAYIHKYPKDLKNVMERVGSTMQHVLKRTIKFAIDSAGSGNKPNPAQLELRLIQSIDEIRKPEIIITVEMIS